LTSNILLLDTPGVIPESEYSHTAKEAIKQHAKVGARTIDKIRDPEMVIVELIKTNCEGLEKFYEVETDEDPEVLIEKVGRKLGFLKKGNQVDEDRTSNRRT